MPLDIEKLVGSLAMIGFRISALMLFAPFLSSAVISPKVKAGFVVAVAALLYPVCGSQTAHLASSASGWVQFVLSEMIVGIVLGLSLNLIFDGAHFAGQMLGIQMGFSLVNVIDPQTQVDSPVLSIFHQTITLLIFLQLNVHHWLLRGLAKSFDYVPVGALVGQVAVVSAIWKAVGGLWVIGVQIAAPALIATMLADVVLGFLGKASPQFPVLFVGISVKSVLGLAISAAALAFWPTRFEQYFASAIAYSERTLQLAR